MEGLGMTLGYTPKIMLLGNLSYIGSAIAARNLIRLGAITRHPEDRACLAADVTRLWQEAGFEPQHNLKSAASAILTTEELI